MTQEETLTYYDFALQNRTIIISSLTAYVKRSMYAKYKDSEDNETTSGTQSIRLRLSKSTGTLLIIGTDFYEGRQAGFFNEEEALHINAFDWEREFPDIFAKGGFDAMIGNPPYVRIQRINHDEADFIY